MSIKKNTKIIMFILSIVGVSLISSLIGFVYSNIYTRLKYTEQTKFLILSIQQRLEKKDPLLEDDLKGFNANFDANYEGNGFIILSEQYFKKQYYSYEFKHQNKF